MEYDKFIVSLYLKDSPLPRAYIEIQKRSKNLYLAFHNLTRKSGYLFIYSNKYAFMKVERDSSFLLENFKYDAPYYFCFIDEQGNSLYGQRGKIDDVNLVNEKFFKKFNQLQKEENLDDLNGVVDTIMLRVFKRRNLTFFEQTKKQLNFLFSCKDRATMLESIIPSSKFIETISEGTRGYAGVVYQNGVPFAVGIGFKSALDGSLKEGEYQFFYDKTSMEGYFLTFRRTSDGDKIDIVV